MRDATTPSLYHTILPVLHVNNRMQVGKVEQPQPHMGNYPVRLTHPYKGRHPFVPPHILGAGPRTQYPLDALIVREEPSVTEVLHLLNASVNVASVVREGKVIVAKEVRVFLCVENVLSP